MPNSVVCSQRVPHLCQLYQHVPISLSFSQISPEKRHVVLQKGNSMFWDGSFTTLRASIADFFGRVFGVTRPNCYQVTKLLCLSEVIEIVS